MSLETRSREHLVIREFSREVIDQVAKLHRMLFPTKNSHGQDDSDRAKYLEAVFLDAPFSDGRLSSLVCEEHGTIVGFLGVLPVPWSFHGRPLLGAVATQFVVHESYRRQFVGLRLLQRFLDGPQDISFADEANDSARTLWEAFGGSTAFSHTWSWTRVLRPAEYAGQLLRCRIPLLAAACPLGRLIDRTIGGLTNNSWLRSKAEVSGEPIKSSLLYEWVRMFSEKFVLRPEYCPLTWQWMIDRVEQKKDNGEFNVILVKNSRHNIIGYYAYYLKCGGVGEVLQMVAEPHATEEVFSHLLHHAFKGGAVALSGRVEPAWMSVLARNRCFFQLKQWSLVHSREQHLVRQFHEGKVWFSRLDGEWPLRYDA